MGVVGYNSSTGRLRQFEGTIEKYVSPAIIQALEDQTNRCHLKEMWVLPAIIQALEDQTKRWHSSERWMLMDMILEQNGSNKSKVFYRHLLPCNKIIVHAKKIKDASAAL